ncbi:DNA mismatch repair protein MutL [Bienertia sinuspersici]
MNGNIGTWCWLQRFNPSNQEVIRRLEEVKNSIHKKNSNDQARGDCPKGLVLGLPTYSKKTNKCLEKEKLNDPIEFQDKESSTVNKEGGIFHGSKNRQGARGKDVNASHDHRQEKVSPMQCEKQSEIAKGKQDNVDVDVEETHFEVGSCKTTKDDQLENGDGDTSSPLMPTQFRFTTNPEIKARKKKGYNIKWRGSFRVKE